MPDFLGRPSGTRLQHGSVRNLEPSFHRNPSATQIPLALRFVFAEATLDSPKQYSIPTLLDFR